MKIAFDKDDNPKVELTKGEQRSLRDTLAICRRLAGRLGDEDAIAAIEGLEGVVRDYAPGAEAEASKP